MLVLQFYDVKAKIPSRFDVNSGNAHIFKSAECYYRQLFLNLVATALMAIEKRFNQESFPFLVKVEQALLKTPVSTSIIGDFYGDDLMQHVLNFIQICLMTYCGKNRSISTT